jgi:hypothetical protein
MRTGRAAAPHGVQDPYWAEGLARAVELLSVKLHAMPSPAGDVEPFVRFVLQIAVAALSLLLDRGPGLQRDLGELAAREARQARAGPDRSGLDPARVVARAGSGGIAMCYITT